MRTVLYTEDFEPITVIDLSGFALSHLQKHRFVTLPVPMKADVIVRDSFEPPPMFNFLVVHIRAETFHTWKGEKLILFTNNEEAALLLQPAFLAGQISALQQERREAFSKGFIHAIQMLGANYE